MITSSAPLSINVTPPERATPVAEHAPIPPPPMGRVVTTGTRRRTWTHAPTAHAVGSGVRVMVKCSLVRQETQHGDPAFALKRVFPRRRRPERSLLSLHCVSGTRMDSTWATSTSPAISMDTRYTNAGRTPPRAFPAPSIVASPPRPPLLPRHKPRRACCH